MRANETMFLLPTDFGSLQQVGNSRWKKKKKKNRLPKRRFSSLCRRGKLIPSRFRFLGAWNSEPSSPADCSCSTFFFVTDDDVSIFFHSMLEHCSLSMFLITVGSWHRLGSISNALPFTTETLLLWHEHWTQNFTSYALWTLPSLHHNTRCTLVKLNVKTR